ncbi:MAG TPA: polysaccharide biosynthesis/export family protein [Kofleriaceae bacterium]|nr:polysaccharide biosynthesis/export family protein [Kofleriaceae bacterium]
MLGRVAIATALSALGLLACGGPPDQNYPSEPVTLVDTSLGAGDLFDIRVYRNEELSASYSVNAEGTISFPLIGEVVVAGKTPEQVESEIRTRLADGYLVDPQVSILVTEYRSKKISIFGQVQKPGTLGYVDGMTIVEAISRAGGFTGMASKNSVKVTRIAGDDKKRFTIPVEAIGQGQAANFFIRPGDIVFVPERLF